jgi:glycosidase
MGSSSPSPSQTYLSSPTSRLISRVLGCRYWSLDISKTNDHFGTGDNLRDLSSALHSRGMYLMLDVVVNHVAATTSSTFKTSSAYGPFDVDTDIHPFCWIDQAYTNQVSVLSLVLFDCVC